MKGMKPETRVTLCGRTCTDCKKWKPWKSFCQDKYGHNNHQARCRICCNQASAIWKLRTNYYQVNRRHILKHKKETYSPEHKKKYDLNFKYGMTLKEFDYLYKQQHGKCKICG